MRSIYAAVSLILVACSASAGDMEAYLEQFGIDKNASFSATRVIEAKEGQIESFVRHDGEKMRMEMNMGGQSAVVITRPDLGKNYMLMPSMNMYREMDMKAMTESGAGDVDFSEASKVGRETVNGHDCTKYRAKFTDAQGGKGGGYYYVNDDGILVKMDMIYQSRGQKGQRMVIENRDIKMGPQDPEYFEVPANYSAFNMGAMMGGMGAGQPGQYPQEPYEEPEFDEKLEEAVEDEAENTVVDEARENVRKGLRKLFD